MVVGGRNEGLVDSRPVSSKFGSPPAVVQCWRRLIPLEAPGMTFKCAQARSGERRHGQQERKKK